MKIFALFFLVALLGVVFADPISALHQHQLPMDLYQAEQLHHHTQNHGGHGGK
jgi:uncharacterized membrane protein